MVVCQHLLLECHIAILVAGLPSIYCQCLCVWGYTTTRCCMRVMQWEHSKTYRITLCLGYQPWWICNVFPLIAASWGVVKLQPVCPEICHGVDQGSGVLKAGVGVENWAMDCHSDLHNTQVCTTGCVFWLKNVELLPLPLVVQPFTQ